MTSRYQSDLRIGDPPLIEHFDSQSDSTVIVSRRIDPGFPFNWHSHELYELTLIVDACGRRFVGDHIDSYRPGDLVLLAPRVPHTWESRRAGYDKAVVIHFSADFFSPWPEAREILTLLESAKLGVQFLGPGRQSVAGLVNQLPNKESLARVTGLLEILQRLATRVDIRPQTLSTSTAKQGRRKVDWRIENALDFIAANTAEDLRQADIAKLVGLDPSSFARLFKRTVGRTFTSYLQSVRISDACRALVDTQNSVSDIAFAVGFCNLAHFNRVFRRLKQMTPSEYRQANHQAEDGYLDQPLSKDFQAHIGT